MEPQVFERIAEAFDLGAVLRVEGIAQGSINTNHRLDTATGRWFVRHTTQRSAQDLRYEAALLAHLAAGHFPGPTLRPTREGAPFLELTGDRTPALPQALLEVLPAGASAVALPGGMPRAVVDARASGAVAPGALGGGTADGGRVSVFAWLPGEERTRAQLTPEHLERLGAELGKLHRLTQSFGPSRENPYGPAQVTAWLRQLNGQRDLELRALAPELARALARAEALEQPLAPRGAIHADLFLDNVKWLGDRVGAFFDFEMACHDAYGLDLAITLNAWCFEETYRPELAQALVRGYGWERALAPEEREGLFAHALFGAVRFTVSRIRDYHLPGLPPERLAPKSFRTYLARVRALEAMGPAGFAALCAL
nr:MULTISPECIES: homoserine kinase [Myxococcaceae]